MSTRVASVHSVYHGSQKVSLCLKTWGIDIHLLIGRADVLQKMWYRKYCSGLFMKIQSATGCISKTTLTDIHMTDTHIHKHTYV